MARSGPRRPSSATRPKIVREVLVRDAAVGGVHGRYWRLGRRSEGEMREMSAPVSMGDDGDVGACVDGDFAAHTVKSCQRAAVRGAYPGRRQTVGASVEAGGNDDGSGLRWGGTRAAAARGGQGMEIPPQAAELAGWRGCMVRGPSRAGWGAASSAAGAVGGEVSLAVSVGNAADGGGEFMGDLGHTSCGGLARAAHGAADELGTPRRNGAVFPQEVAPAFPVELNEASAACREGLTANSVGEAKGGGLASRAAARAFRVRAAESGNARRRPGGGLRGGRGELSLLLDVVNAAVSSPAHLFEALPHKGGDAVQVMLKARPAVACKQEDVPTEVTWQVCEVSGDRRFVGAGRGHPKALAQVQVRRDAPPCASHPMYEGALAHAAPGTARGRRGGRLPPTQQPRDLVASSLCPALSCRVVRGGAPPFSPTAPSSTKGRPRTPRRVSSGAAETGGCPIRTHTHEPARLGRLGSRGGLLPHPLNIPLNTPGRRRARRFRISGRRARGRPRRRPQPRNLHLKRPAPRVGRARVTAHEYLRMAQIKKGGLFSYA
ncbi:hypothetical protein ACSSS7_007347 [Eimeria intestinalis]